MWKHFQKLTKIRKTRAWLASEDSKSDYQDDLVGASTDKQVGEKEAQKIVIPELSRQLEPAGDAKLNWGLRGPGLEWAEKDKRRKITDLNCLTSLL